MTKEGKGGGEKERAWMLFSVSSYKLYVHTGNQYEVYLCAY